MLFFLPVKASYLVSKPPYYSRQQYHISSRTGSKQQESKTGRSADRVFRCSHP